MSTLHEISKFYLVACIILYSFTTLFRVFFVCRNFFVSLCVLQVLLFRVCIGIHEKRNTKHDDFVCHLVINNTNFFHAFKRVNAASRSREPFF